ERVVDRRAGGLSRGESADLDVPEALSMKVRSQELERVPGCLVGDEPQGEPRARLGWEDRLHAPPPVPPVGPRDVARGRKGGPLPELRAGKAVDVLVDT